MANVSHASLTGSNLHEPKGVETATVGQAYLANGLGSGAWTTLSGLSLTGMIASFTTPIAPSGWYELDGSTISDATDPALYSVMTIQQTASRLSGSPIISGFTTTTNMKVGYYIYGTGITAGTTIISVDSSTDITMSANAASSGSSNVIVSPWQLTAGGIVLPDMTTAGRYLRSRSSSTRIGLTQANQNKQHLHSATTNNTGAHTHAGNVSGGKTNDNDVDHTHSYSGLVPASGTIFATTSGTGFTQGSLTSGGQSAAHKHVMATTSDGNHTHTFNTDNEGGTEARPESLVVMWCVKR